MPAPSATSRPPAARAISFAPGLSAWPPIQPRVVSPGTAASAAPIAMRLAARVVAAFLRSTPVRYPLAPDRSPVRRLGDQIVSRRDDGQRPGQAADVGQRGQPVESQNALRELGVAGAGRVHGDEELAGI